jgi:D-sedoheptulose 7-phosphate isomerase
MIKKTIKEAILIKEKILNDNQLLETIEFISNIIIQTYKKKRKILIAGNGGSAADAQHIAAEFVSRFYIDRPGIPAIALTTDTSILTAIGNDYSFENVMSRQIETLGVSGDVFWAISTSGNSKNIVKAINSASKQGITTIGLTGNSENSLAKLCDYCICVPSQDTPRVQEAHILIAHIICGIVEEKLFAE